MINQIPIFKDPERSSEVMKRPLHPDLKTASFPAFIGCFSWLNEAFWFKGWRLNETYVDISISKEILYEEQSLVNN